MVGEGRQRYFPTLTGLTSAQCDLLQCMHEGAGLVLEGRGAEFYDLSVSDLTSVSGPNAGCQLLHEAVRYDDLLHRCSLVTALVEMPPLPAQPPRERLNRHLIPVFGVPPGRRRYGQRETLSKG